MASTLPFELGLAEISICAHQWPSPALQATCSAGEGH